MKNVFTLFAVVALLWLGGAVARSAPTPPRNHQVVAKAAARHASKAPTKHKKRTTHRRTTSKRKVIAVIHAEFNMTVYEPSPGVSASDIMSTPDEPDSSGKLRPYEYGSDVRMGRMATVIADRAQLHETRNSASRVYCRVNMGTLLIVEMELEEWSGVLLTKGPGRGVTIGWVQNSLLEFSEYPTVGWLHAVPDVKCEVELEDNDVIRAAREYCVTYDYGGVSPTGRMDAPAFVRSVFWMFDVNLPRTAREQAAVGTDVRPEDMQPGDRLYFSCKGRYIDHCGIYAGKGYFIHCSPQRNGVGFDKLTDDFYWKSLEAIKRCEFPPEYRAAAVGAAAPDEVKLGRVAKVIADIASIYASRDSTSRVYCRVKNGTPLAVTKEMGDWSGVLMVNRAVGWLKTSFLEFTDFDLVAPESEMKSAPTSSNSEPPLVGEQIDSKIIRDAMSYRGVTYAYGGADPNGGMDSSAFVQSVFRKSGIKLPRTAREQSHVGVDVRAEDLKPGDRLYFSSKKSNVDHCGIYAGNGYFIHCSSSRNGVGFDNLADDFFWKNLAAIKR